MGNVLKFAHHASNFPCWLCAVSRLDGSVNALNDCKKDAAWKRSLVPPLAGTLAKATEHPILSITGASRFSFTGDIQHSMNLGTDSYLAGAILGDIVLNAGWTGTKVERTQKLWQLIRDQYDAYGTQIRLATLRETMFLRSGQFAELHAHAVETYNVLLALGSVLVDLDDGSLYHRMRLETCNSLLGLHKIFDEADVFLSAEQSTRALELADRFLLYNNYLCRESLRRGQLLYHMTVKTHLMWHLADQSKFLNPKLTACFEFEHYQGLVKKCAQSAMAGSGLVLVGNKVMEHSLLALHLRLERAMAERG